MRFFLNTNILLLLSCQATSARTFRPDAYNFAGESSESSFASKLYGFQSGGFHSNIEAIPDTSSSYGSSLHYDARSRLVYVTGATYWSYWDRTQHTEDTVSDLAQLDHSDCFFAVLDPPNSDEDSSTMDLVYSRRLGKREFDEACSAQTIVATKDGGTEIVQAGYTEDGGILTDSRGWGSPLSKMYGILFSYDLGVIQDEFEKPGVSEHLHGARLFNDHIVQYLVAVTSNPVADRNDGGIYTASISSYIGTPNTGIVRGERPDLTSAEQPGFGEQFIVSIEKIVPKTQEEIDYEEEEAALVSGLVVNGQTHYEGVIKDTMKAEWTEQFSPELNRQDITTRHHLQVDDMLYAPHVEDSDRFDILVIVGSTTGFGSIFGDLSMNPDLDDTFPFDTESEFKDGFISMVSTEGEMLDATRLSTGIHDVIVHGACIDTFEEHSVDYIYVVGETMGHLDMTMKKQDLSVDKKGNISKHAFISKINIDIAEIEWTRQLGGTHANDVASYGCAVTPGGGMVYMAGTVSGGDTIRIPGSESTESFGNDDIFVASYDSNSGEQFYVKQHGTSNNDSLAKGRGIVTDKKGNGIILGNTRGSMMRWRESDASITMKTPVSDVFVLSVDRDTGAMMKTAEVTGRPTDLPKQPNDDNVYTFEGETKLLGVDIFAIAVGVCIALFTSLYIGYASTRSRTVEKRGHTKTMEYLAHFNDPDHNLNIKDSATGGVHGTYSERYPELSNSDMDQVHQVQSKYPRPAGTMVMKTSRRSSAKNDISEVMNETKNFGSQRGMTTVDLLSDSPTNSSRSRDPRTPTNSVATHGGRLNAPSSDMFVVESLPSDNTNEMFPSSRPSTGVSYARSDQNSEDSSISFGEIL